LIANPQVTFVETQHGGHCAFLAAAAADDGRWAERMLLGFLMRDAAGLAHGG
jgi:predicted alpha/beta-fold hydrolase